MKRILTIQDISCLGKCSLTIALPIISAMGVETVILPTALLSTHTMFKHFTCLDLSDQILPVTQVWEKEGVTFDAIYTGYLGTEEEIDLVLDVIKRFRGPDTLVFVDPAMGDHGRLYAAFDMHYAKKNAELCAAADFIVPNITEACFMTDAPWQETYDTDYILELLERLKKLGPRTAAITGVSLAPGKTGVMGMNCLTGELFSYQNEKIPVSYHGTGDIFSSVTAAALTRGLESAAALKLAADYTALTIGQTLRNPRQPWYGVDFEATIPSLIAMLDAALNEKSEAESTNL